jgi:hypothetical protein
MMRMDMVGAPADEAATHAYVVAVYAWVQSVVANLPASDAAVEGLASRIGGECQGVLVGAPSGIQSLFLQRPASARERGELAREAEQTSKLEEELSWALSSAWLAPDQQAAAAFASALAPLQWSNPVVTQAVHLDAARPQEQFGISSPGVCADIRAWVASGSRTLSVGTKEFISRREAMSRQSLHARPLHPLLAPYEGPDKALIHKTKRIASRVAIVPARLRGPVGLYYQVVRGPSPIPVSLTEFDAHGGTLRVLKLPRVVECTRHPLKYLPGGIRTLVHESVPQGPTFSIVGKGYRFLGHLHFALKVNIEAEPKFGFGASSISSGSSIGVLGRQPSPSPRSSKRTVIPIPTRSSTAC